ncbi:DMT family transporter [Pelagibacteraceae bacterium]|nr:DMT family transporter [Pelagibacteraceae bacterium]
MNYKSNPYSYGIILILLTYLSFGILDTIQKTAVQYHSVFVLLFVKYTFCLIFSFFIAKKNNVKNYYLSNNYKIQITRCILSVCEACFFVLSFRYLALAEAHTIGSLAPVLVVFFSYLILKEKINLATWVAIGISFFGVILIMRPGLTIFNPYLVIPLLAAFFYSLFQIATRLNARYDDNETMLFYNGLIGVIITSILSIFFWQPLHSFSFIFFIFVGFFFCMGLFLQIKALSITPASVLAPYNYTIIVWAIFFGLIVYKEIPDIFTIIGAIIIVASGVFIFRYSYK